LWSKQTRYLGVGAMVVGGLWALIKLRTSLTSGIRSGVRAYKESRQGGASGILRTERDIPIHWVGMGVAISVVPLALLFYFFTKSLAVAAFMAVAMLVAAFLFSAVASYMAGLVGSSNNPISGVTIATILTAALLLLGLSKMGLVVAQGAASAILIGAVVCCASAIGGDNMQDLKAGRILGATPYKQQIMQSIGVLSASIVMAPVLSLLQHAYGIGIPTPDHPRPLAAPQATLMASVAGGVFEGGLPMAMILIGAAIAVGIILVDLWLESRGSSFRTPVLAVAVGIYLPFELSVPIFIGGWIAWAASRAFPRKDESALKTAAHNGLLFSSGLITGEALMGIGIAILIILQKRMGFDISLGMAGTSAGKLLGLGLLMAVSIWLFRVASRKQLARSPDRAGLE
jgi:putative OPT family oligopeptide transporter